jgi:hypothetical protein
MELVGLASMGALCFLLPLEVAWAEPVAGDPVDDSAAIPPGEPDVAAPLASPAPAPAPAASPEEPEFKGKGLLAAAIAVTGFSWASRITALGLYSSIDDCADVNSCTSKLSAYLAFTYMAPISQFIATGLVIPGALLKGRHDAWRHNTTGKPDRNAKAFTIAGGVIFGVFTAASIALRPGVLFGCLNIGLAGGSGCNGIGAVTGYYLGVQASDTLSTVGAGLMTYGIAYGSYRRKHAPKVSIAPFGGGHTYGLTLAGDF